MERLSFSLSKVIFPFEEAKMSSDYETDIASVQVIAEKEATGKVKDIYEEIQKT